MIDEALFATRETRRTFAQGASLPADLVVVLGACPSCDRAASGTLAMAPGGVYGTAPERPGYRNLRELAAIVLAIVESPPPLASGDDTPGGDACVCGAKLTDRIALAARFYHAMPGAGAELIVEARRVAPREGAEVPAPSWALRALRSPLDGYETELEAFEDSAVVAAFGRGVTLADAFSAVLSAARESAGEPVVQQVERGLWLYASTQREPLESAIRALIARDPDARAVPLELLGRTRTIRPEMSWLTWAREHAPALREGSLAAGAMVDLGTLTRTAQTALARGGLSPARIEGGVLVARKGEAVWPIEVAQLAVTATLMGLTLEEISAATCDEVRARLEAIESFLAAARKFRPEVRFDVQGTQLVATRPTGGAPRAASLLTAPFTLRAGTPEFEREMRFLCDNVPPWADPTRVCPCGASALLVVRMLPWTTVAQVAQSAGGQSPLVVDRWPSEQPRAAAVVTISCDRHVRVPLGAELAALGIAREELTRRLRQDIAHSAFQVATDVQRDRDGHVALLVRGAMAASAMTEDQLLSSLHEACGAPLSSRTAAKCVAAGTDLVCLYDAAFDPPTLDRLLTVVATHTGARPAFVIGRDARLDALPVGRFVVTTGPRENHPKG